MFFEQAYADEVVFTAWKSAIYKTMCLDQISLIKH